MENKPLKLLYLDLETTGTSYWQHCIHQIAIIIEINGIEKEKFDFKVKPHPAAIIEDEALSIAGVTRETITGFAYFEQQQVFKSLIEVLGKYVDKFDKRDKFHIVAYNGSSFDVPFFRAFFAQCGDKYFGSWFWSACIDVMILSAQYLIDERSEMENFKQSTVAKQFGINVDESKLHDAVYDLEVCREIYRYMYPV